MNIKPWMQCPFPGDYHFSPGAQYLLKNATFSPAGFSASFFDIWPRMLKQSTELWKAWSCLPRASLRDPFKTLSNKTLHLRFNSWEGQPMESQRQRGHLSGLASARLSGLSLWKQACYCYCYYCAVVIVVTAVVIGMGATILTHTDKGTGHPGSTEKTAGPSETQPSDWNPL